MLGNEQEMVGNDEGGRFVTVQTAFTTKKHLHILIVYSGAWQLSEQHMRLWNLRYCQNSREIFWSVSRNRLGCECEWKRTAILWLPDVFWNCCDMIVVVMHSVFAKNHFAVHVKRRDRDGDRASYGTRAIGDWWWANVSFRYILMASVWYGVLRDEKLLKMLVEQLKMLQRNYNSSSLIIPILHRIRLVMRFADNEHHRFEISFVLVWWHISVFTCYLARVEGVHCAV